MLNRRDIADHQVIAAVREHDDLQKRCYTIIKLDEPFQRGWRRFYELSERALARPDRSILEAILAVIGPEVVHHSCDFRRRRGRQRKLIEIEQPLRPIPLSEWERKGYPDRWHSYFRRELVLEWNRYWPHWVFTQPSLFELKVERNWQWYFREVDPAIETRLSELDRWLESREGWQRYGWLKGQRRYRHKEGMESRTRILNREQEREMNRAYSDFPEVDPTASTRCGRISFRRILALHHGC